MMSQKEVNSAYDQATAQAQHGTASPVDINKNFDAK